MVKLYIIKSGKVHIMNNSSYNFDNAKKENNPSEFKRQVIRVKK